MNSFDFEALKREIVTASGQAIREVADAHSEEELIAFALYSDEGAMTVCPAINTKSHLVKCQAENPQYRLDYKFSPAEWRFESVGAADLFNAICEKVSNEVLEEESDFPQFQQQLYKTCFEALMELKKELSGLSEYANMMLLFSVSDSDIDERQTKMMKQLNDSTTAAEFLAWAKEQS